MDILKIYAITLLSFVKCEKMENIFGKLIRYEVFKNKKAPLPKESGADLFYKNMINSF